MISISKLSTPNQSNGKTGRMVQHFVLHRADGGFDGAVAWCRDAKAQVSYHFIVNTDGHIVQLVDVDNIAWHAGRIHNPTCMAYSQGDNPNYTTIGICVSYKDLGHPTTEQYCAVAALIVHYGKIKRMPDPAASILVHREIRSDKSCPGLFSKDEVIRRVEHYKKNPVITIANGLFI